MRVPTRFSATALIEVKGLINTRAPGFRSLHRYVAGAEPIDRPKTTMFSASTFKVSVKKSKTQ